MSSANEHLAPSLKPRMSPLDFRNTDLVSRLLAATPPYLYNMSLLPNTYFFSEMLRSFVQAKVDANNRPGSVQPRRARKRPWSRPDQPPKTASPKPESSDWMLKSSFPKETALELTTKPEQDSDSVKKLYNPNMIDRKDLPLESMFPHNQDLILPPPPPLWYPPLYPTTPYGIDPLHFFIDLRVSGQIYDKKKKDNETETSSNNSEDHFRNGFKPSRHASAFSVPTSQLRHNIPMNLSTEDSEVQEVKKFDVKSLGFDKKTNRTGSSYVMGNLVNIYKNIGESQVKNEGETEEEKQKRMKDLRALIGLELVVDYMSHKPEARKLNSEETNSIDLESVGSPALEVVAIHDET